jgi:hypothetical protein
VDNGQNVALFLKSFDGAPLFGAVIVCGAIFPCPIVQASWRIEYLAVFRQRRFVCRLKLRGRKPEKL